MKTNYDNSDFIQGVGFILYRKADEKDSKDSSAPRENSDYVPNYILNYVPNIDSGASKWLYYLIIAIVVSFIRYCSSSNNNSDIYNVGYTPVIPVTLSTPTVLSPISTNPSVSPLIQEKE